MIMINNIGGATLSAALVADRALAPVKPDTDTSFNADLSASVAAYLSLPGFNATSPLQSDTTSSTDTGDQSSALVNAVSQDETLKTALQEFDAGLKKLVDRPETQIYSAKLGDSSGAQADTTSQIDPLLSPEPLPGVGEDGVLGVPPPDTSLAADTNHDGKVSEEERIRYEAPLTYRSLTTQDTADAATDGPNVFSLSEVNSAYGAGAATQAA